MTDTNLKAGDDRKSAAPAEPSGDRPLVTFAVFAYNQERYIREAIDGAFAQTYTPLEIILSDDCSTDRTFEIMQEMAAAYRGPHQVRVRRSEANRGLAGHINDVLAVSKGEIVSWAAGDDIALPRRTSVFLSRLLENQSYVGVHSDIEEIDTDGNFIRYRNHSNDEACVCLSKVTARGQSVITQSHAFKKWVFDAFGPFREDLSQEGIAMAFRECVMGNIAFVKEPLTKYRIGSGTSTYVGKDLIKKKELEPIKYTNWYLSAFRQMYDDSKKTSHQLPASSSKNIAKNLKFYKSLMKINEGDAILRPLISNLLIFPSDIRSIRAVVRVSTPSILYKLFLK